MGEKKNSKVEIRKSQEPADSSSKERKKEREKKVRSTYGRTAQAAREKLPGRVKPAAGEKKNVEVKKRKAASGAAISKGQTDKDARRVAGGHNKIKGEREK